MIHTQRKPKPLMLTVSGALLIILFALMSLGTDCEESLPAYEQPEDVLKLDLYSTVPEPMRLRFDKIRIMGGIVALSFDLNLVNQFDETISGTLPARIGRLDLFWDEDPEVIASLDITYEEEAGTNYFNPIKPVAIDPGDTASFLIVWRNFEDNHGTRMWDYVPLGDRTEDDLHIYYNHLPMHFTARAHMQPVSGGPVAYSEEFSFVITFYTVESK